MASSRSLSLPPELLREIFRFSAMQPSVWSQCRPHLEDSCVKSNFPLEPVIRHGNNNSLEPPPFEPSHPIKFVEKMATLRNLSMVSKTVKSLSAEFLYETLHISTINAAKRLAILYESYGASDPMSPNYWTQNIVIVVAFRRETALHDAFVEAIIRIIHRTPRLQAFYLKWNTYSANLRRLEERLIEALPSSLRRFEWHSVGGGFTRPHQHAFYNFLQRARLSLEIIEISGYLPLPDADTMVEVNEGVWDGFPALRHLSVKRAFLCDLALMDAWVSSDNLTCLSIGTIWSYYDHREATAHFFTVPRPSLQCLHLGKDTRLCPQLARCIMESAPNLQVFEYYFLGDWDDEVWKGIGHSKLKDISIGLSHPSISARSLFRKFHISREQAWDKLQKHIQFFSTSRRFSSLRRVDFHMFGTGKKTDEIIGFVQECLLENFPPEIVTELSIRHPVS